jgi:hypothetical protein
MRPPFKLLVLVCGTFVAASLFAWSSEKGPQTPANSLELTTLMQAKLASSQRITEGLVTKDFELIRKGAEELRRIAAATKWYSQADPVFAQHRGELSRQTEKLIRAAEEKNLDAAAYTYFGSLRTCIGCHEYCRDVLRVPALRRNPKAVSPIPVTDDEASSAAQPASGR